MRVDLQQDLCARRSDTPTLAAFHWKSALPGFGARQLEGRAVRVSFVVESLSDVIQGKALVDAEGKAGASPSIRFGRGMAADRLDLDKRPTIDGIVRTRIVPAYVIDFERFEATCEIEAREAQSVIGPRA